MSAVPVIVPDISPQPRRAPRAQVAMSCLIAAESAIFTIFVVAYLFYLDRKVKSALRLTLRGSAAAHPNRKVTPS